VGGLAFVLVHSPLVGPATWQPVADDLAARGVRVVIPDFVDVADASPPWWQVVAARVAAAVSAADVDDVVLVGHSGAGSLLPVIGDAVPARVEAYVFVDAQLPPESGVVPPAPADFLAFLDALAVDGTLPPWSQWWGPDAMARLVPDAATRDEIERELPRLPLAYFREQAPVASGWNKCRVVFLRLSEGYEPQASTAASLGWPVDRLDAGHLHAVVAPTDVTDRILLLLDGIDGIPR
jgi:pimeloyl-ACP methyl ester carboxylesterase